MKKLAIFFASFVVGAAAFAGALSSNSVAETLKPPRQQDECMCGGQINYVYDHQETYGSTRACFYAGYAPNGSYVNTLVIYKSIVQLCGPTP